MKKSLLLILLTSLLIGCGIGSESVEDKMLRMAKARSAANKQQADDEEEERALPITDNSTPANAASGSDVKTGGNDDT